METNIETSENKTPNVKFESAPTNMRLLNFILDSICVIVLSALWGIVLGIILAITGNESFLEDENSMSAKLFGYVAGIFASVTYYNATEFIFKGKTLAKFLTGTRAVTIDYQEMDAMTTLKRSLYRLVPFDALSFLGGIDQGWHDTFSKTRVIVDKNWKSKDTDNTLKI